MGIDAAPVIDLKVPTGQPYVLVPALRFETVETGGGSQQELDVLGFGRSGNSLYLHVRLHQNLDLSLKKGWGKAFQLLDSKNGSCLYDSYSLPSAVQLHDALVDLPDDLRAKQTVVDNYSRDLYLHFPDYPTNATPIQLRVIEAFQGDSPANPGFIYVDLPLIGTGEIQERPAIMALASLDHTFDTTGSAVLQENVSIAPQRLWIDENFLPHLSWELDAPVKTNIVLKDCVLIDDAGSNYNLLQLEETVAVNVDKNQPASVEYLFERLPETANIEKIWLKLTVNETDREITFPL